MMTERCLYVLVVCNSACTSIGRGALQSLSQGFTIALFVNNETPRSPRLRDRSLTARQ